MCGRFALTASSEEIAKQLDLDFVEAFPPRYNIAPAQPIHMVMVNAANKMEMRLVRWGFIPAWVKDPGEFTLLVNARSETAAQKPSFRNAMRHRRTLVPVTGFYEWRRTGKGTKGSKSQAFWIRPAKGGIVYIGGLAETWSGPDGSEIDTGCILTTAANSTMAKIHHRLPVVIKPEDIPRWLDCRTQQPADVADLMQPVEEGFFEAIPVGDLVNKVANNGPEVQQPAAEAKTCDEMRDASKKQDPQKDTGQMDLF